MALLFSPTDASATVCGRTHRRQLQLPCGGTVALDWLPRPRSPTDTLGDDTPVVLVLHGLTGGTCEPHVRWLLKMAQRRRWRAVLLNSRGCSGCAIVHRTSGTHRHLTWIWVPRSRLHRSVNRGR